MGVAGFVNHEEIGMDFGTKWQEEKLQQDHETRFIYTMQWVSNTPKNVAALVFGGSDVFISRNLGYNDCKLCV